MKDRDVVKWLIGIFVLAFVIAIWISPQDGPECDNSQYSTQSC